MSNIKNGENAGKKYSIGSIAQKLGPLLGLVVLIVVVSINPSFLAPLNILNLLRQVAINALIAFWYDICYFNRRHRFICRCNIGTVQYIDGRYDGFWDGSDFSYFSRLLVRCSYSYGGSKWFAYYER